MATWIARTSLAVVDTKDWLARRRPRLRGNKLPVELCRGSKLPPRKHEKRALPSLDHRLLWVVLTLLSATPTRTTTVLPKRRDPIESSPDHDFDAVSPEAAPRPLAAQPETLPEPHRIVFVARRSAPRPRVAMIATICSLG
jgi:hypothetical protein